MAFGQTLALLHLTWGVALGYDGKWLPARIKRRCLYYSHRRNNAMSLVLEYENTKDDLHAQYELHMANYLKLAKPQYFRRVWISTALLVMASYCAYEARLYGFLAIFVVTAVCYLTRSLPYSRNCQTSIEKSFTNRSDSRIRLEVKDDGLLETEEGIQSFVPWSSVKSFSEFRNTLFINLNAGLCAVIPRRSVTTGTSTVDRLIAVLREKGVTELENSA